MWESVEKRITWDQADLRDIPANRFCSSQALSLTPLPYDTGVFDMVHIRFVGLGIPEGRWGDVIDEAVRVLKRGGKLEIVEMSYDLPAAAPQSLRNSFASLLLSDLISPLPILPLRFCFPLTAALITASVAKPVFEMSWTDPPGALRDAATIWVKSALDYKGTGLVAQSTDLSPAHQKGMRGPERGGCGEKAVRVLRKAHGERWAGLEVDGPCEEEGEAKVTVWAWVATKE